MSKLVKQNEARTKQGWSVPVRVLVALAGGGLLFYGLRRKTSRFGKIATQLGVGLITRGLADTQFSGLVAFITSTLLKPEALLTPYKSA